MIALLRRFFLFCSGTPPDILSLARSSSETTKYGAVGATVFFTAAVAGLTGTYAIHRVFGPRGIPFLASVIVGVLWAGLIFNLDRYIVSSLRKHESKLLEFRHAAPRFALAIMISLAIATPTEVALFQEPIKLQLHDMTQRGKIEARRLTDEVARVPQLERETADLRSERDKLALELQQGPTDTAFSSLQTNLDACRSGLDRATTERDRDAPRLEGERQQASVQERQRGDEEVRLIQQRDVIDQRLRRLRGEVVTAEADGNAEDLARLRRERDDAEREQSQVLTRLAAVRESLGSARRRMGEASVKGKALEGRVAAKLKECDAYSRSLDAMVGQHAATKKQKLQEISRALGEKEPQLQQASLRASTAHSQIEALVEDALKRTLPNEVKALWELAARDRFGAIWWTTLFLWTFFFLIEAAPMLVKLFSPRGPYDDALHVHEAERAAELRESAIFYEERGRARFRAIAESMAESDVITKRYSGYMADWNRFQEQWFAETEKRLRSILDFTARVAEIKDPVVGDQGERERRTKSDQEFHRVAMEAMEQFARRLKELMKM